MTILGPMVVPFEDEDGSGRQRVNNNGRAEDASSFSAAVLSAMALRPIKLRRKVLNSVSLYHNPLLEFVLVPVSAMLNPASTKLKHRNDKWPLMKLRMMRVLLSTQRGWTECADA